VIEVALEANAVSVAYRRPDGSRATVVSRVSLGLEPGRVPQDPATSLNPARRIGRQPAQLITTHRGLTGRQHRERAADLLDRVGITNPGQALWRYPHEFSGGQQQRIALALPCPAILGC
jgi:ABC-type microcin C transport system duplicated ATPase subunit YejF